MLGPNVEGFVNYVDRVAPYGTTPPPEPVPGSISVISQSGTVAWAMNQLASDRGVGLRIILGVGNEAVLGLGEMFEWAASDPKTKVVTSYIETMRDVEGIGRGLDALRAAGKPVLICAPEGRSEAARRSIVAHTGALAGNTTLRDAWLRAQGVVLVEDPVTMFEAALLLSKVKKIRTTGIAAALQSGGACTLFAEAAGSAGLELPEFSSATKRALRAVLPHFASQNNPLDVTGQAAVETEMYEGALEALADDPAVGLIAFDAFPPRIEGETPWADAVLEKVKDLRRRDRGRLRERRDGSRSPTCRRRSPSRGSTPCRSCRAITRPRAPSGRSSSSRGRRAGRPPTTCRHTRIVPRRCGRCGGTRARSTRPRARGSSPSTGWRVPASGRSRRRPRRRPSPARSGSRWS